MEDSNGWLVTFSDLVLQLFAFVLVAAVLGTGSLSRDAVPAPVTVASRDAASEVRSARPARRADRVLRSAPDALTLARFDVPAPAPVEPEGSVQGTPAVAVRAVGAEHSAPPAVASAPAVAATAAAAAAATAPAESPDAEPPPSLARELESFGAAAGLADAVHVAVNGGGVTLSISDTIGFPSGSAELLPDAAQVLFEVRALVASRPELVVEVSGHTDDRPLHAGAFRSNLELSLARAARVAHELAAGDDALTERIFAAGYGAARPVAANHDAEGRARNRRVELRLVPGRNGGAELALAR